MDDRIRLAEKMGYKTTRQSKEWHGPTWEGRTPEGERTWRLPDPFTDAYDDVAVNEWAVKNLDPDAYFAALSEVVGGYCYLHEYRIGHFARAALKVLERDDEY